MTYLGHKNDTKKLKLRIPWDTKRLMEYKIYNLYVYFGSLLINDLFRSLTALYRENI